MTFEKDPSHWLFKLTPHEWVRAAMGELRRAEEAYKAKNGRAGLAGARRAAGMALNGALICEPNEGWGRSYMDHLLALKTDASLPEQIRASCTLLLETPLPGGELVALRTSGTNEKVLEAARDVMAHAYSVVAKHSPPDADSPS